MYRDGIHWTEGPSHLLLPKACSKTNQWPFLWSSLRSTQGRPSGALLKWAFLTSVAVSLSSSLPFIPPGRALRSSLMNAASPGPSLVTSAVSVSALSRYNCFSFWIFFSERVFFLQGPLLMQFPVILLALSLYLNWLRSQSLGRDPRSWLPEPVCDISGPCASAEHSPDAPL